MVAILIEGPLLWFLFGPWRYVGNGCVGSGLNVEGPEEMREKPDSQGRTLFQILEGKRSARDLSV